MALPESAPKTAMVLAAGEGKRMRPISATLPKPLVKIGDRALIDHCLDGLASAGIEKAVVNVHHLADKIEAHLKARSAAENRRSPTSATRGLRPAAASSGRCRSSAKSPSCFGTPIPSGSRACARIFAGWPALGTMARMDALLLLASTVYAVGYSGRGDFLQDKEGRLSRRAERSVAPFVYAGAAILAPRLFDAAPDGAFSLNILFDRAIAAGRLFGVRLDGLWINVETPSAIAPAEAAIAASAA